jgi:hypothetical protein
MPKSFDMAKSPLNLALLTRTRDAVNADRDFRRLGTCDARVGLKVGDSAFVVEFAAFECAAVSAVDVDALRDADFYLELSPAAWQGYLDGRRAGTGPTLVSLDVDTPDRIVKGTDPLKALKFERYHLTLQSFFDTGARLAA